MKRTTRKWTTLEQAVFLKRVGELLERGYPLIEAMISTTYQFGNIRKQQIEICIDQMKEGNPFYSTLQSLDFHKSLVDYVYFAERHGDLSVALLEGSSLMVKQEGNRHEVKKILSYPLMLLIVTAILIFFVKNYLVPRFLLLFDSMGLESSVFSIMVYLFDNLLLKLLAVCLSTLLTLLIYYYYYYKKKPAISQKELLCRIPVFGAFYRLLLTHYFTIQLSYLLGGGLSILEAIKQFKGNENNAFDQEVGNYLEDGLTKGKSLEERIGELTCLEPDLAMIIQHGQRNGRLNQELYFYSKDCLEMFQSRMSTWLKYLQPSIFGIIGVLIISMYLAILLPMFHLMDGF